MAEGYLRGVLIRIVLSSVVIFVILATIVPVVFALTLIACTRLGIGATLT